MMAYNLLILHIKGKLTLKLEQAHRTFIDIGSHRSDTEVIGVESVETATPVRFC